MINKNQNTSHAVMAQRHEPPDSLDDFPTPPWATRALCEQLGQFWEIENQAVWEPACGRGNMVRPLDEYFERVYGSDIHDYGAGYEVEDFLFPGNAIPGAIDWIITNPPFRLAIEFYEAAREWDVGVALLCRTVFLEGIHQYHRIFEKHPPLVMQFVERVPMVRGRLDPKATTATAYTWFVWPQNDHGICPLQWIPPCRRRLERDGDYRI